MAATSDIIALAKAKLAEISKLQGELDELRHILNGVGSKAPRGELVATRTKRAAGRHPRQRRQPNRRARAKQPNSSSSRSETIISGVGHPLHVDVLIEKIQSRFNETVAKQTLVSSLSRLAKNGDRFVRTAPNTFGLIGMEEGKK